jgi:hypothetical protein
MRTTATIHVSVSTPTATDLYVSKASIFWPVSACVPRLPSVLIAKYEREKGTKGGKSGRTILTDYAVRQLDAVVASREARFTAADDPVFVLLQDKPGKKIQF